MLVNFKKLNLLNKLIEEYDPYRSAKDLQEATKNLMESGLDLQKLIALQTMMKNDLNETAEEKAKKMEFYVKYYSIAFDKAESEVIELDMKEVKSLCEKFRNDYTI